MPTRNTSVLVEIVRTLGDQVADPEESLARLEKHFEKLLIVVAGTEKRVATFAEYLRLAITTEECALVLDDLASKQAVRMTHDHVEEAINRKFPDRFIEP